MLDRLERLEVASLTHERHPNNVSVLSDHLEIFEVFRA